jgi:virginiamycin B lyase
VSNGPLNSVWFYSSSFVGHVTPAGQVSETMVSQIPLFSQGIDFMAPGYDGRIWFTLSSYDRIFRISTSGAIDTTLKPAYVGQPGDLLRGPGGAMWFADGGLAGGPPPMIGRIDSHGRQRYFVDRFPGPGPGPFVQRNGQLWFLDGGTRIGRLTSQGKFVRYQLPASCSANSLTAAPDGNLWFTCLSLPRRKGEVGRMTPRGRVTLFKDIPVNADPMAIGVGPDQNVWFTAQQNSSDGNITRALLGRIALH